MEHEKAAYEQRLQEQRSVAEASALANKEAAALEATAHRLALEAEQQQGERRVAQARQSMQVELDAAVADMRAAEERYLASQQAERVAHARAVGKLRAQLEMETAAMQEELTRERQAT